MNSKRLFVTRSDSFNLSVMFTKDGKMKVAKHDFIPENEKEQWEKFEIEFVLPDFGTAKGIMRNSVEFDRGTQVLNTGMFNNNLLLALARKWNLKDEDGKEIPMDLQKLNELRPDITRVFIELLQEKLSQEGLYESILAS